MDGRYDAGEDDDKEDEYRGLDGAVEDLPTTDHKNKNQCQCAENFGKRAREFTMARHFDHCASIVLVGSGEASFEVIFSAERLDGLETR